MRHFPLVLSTILFLTKTGCLPLPTTPDPDGQEAPRRAQPRIAWVHEGAVWSVDPELDPGVEAPRLLIDGLTHDRPIAWSPDGQTLLFWKHSDIGWDIWAIDSDGGNPRNLTQVEQGGCRSPAWSPDGTEIAFMRDDPPGLYVMEADGENQTRVSSFGHRDEFPAWSPEGRRLVFGHRARSRDDNPAKRLAVVNRDGTQFQWLTADDGSAGSPQWSQNGRWVLFAGRRDGNGDIFLIYDIEKREEINLTQSPEEDSDPVWSPGERYIAYITVSDAHRLMIMQANGKNPRILASIEGRLGTPSWSPDGKRLVVSSVSAADPSVHVVNIDGSGLRRLGAGAFAVWQPQGTLLAPPISVQGSRISEPANPDLGDG